MRLFTGAEQVVGIAENDQLAGFDLLPPRIKAFEFAQYVEIFGSEQVGLQLLKRGAF